MRKVDKKSLFMDGFIVEMVSCVKGKMFHRNRNPVIQINGISYLYTL